MTLYVATIKNNFMYREEIQDTVFFEIRHHKDNLKLCYGTKSILEATGKFYINWKQCLFDQSRTLTKILEKNLVETNFLHFNNISRSASLSKQ